MPLALAIELAAHGPSRPSPGFIESPRLFELAVPLLVVLVAGTGRLSDSSGKSSLQFKIDSPPPRHRQMSLIAYTVPRSHAVIENGSWRLSLDEFVVRRTAMAIESAKSVYEWHSLTIRNDECMVRPLCSSGKDARRQWVVHSDGDGMRVWASTQISKSLRAAGESSRRRCAISSRR
jgi:hypothetical protein